MAIEGSMCGGSVKMASGARVFSLIDGRFWADACVCAR